jgi:hypothetical protein
VLFFSTIDNCVWEFIRRVSHRPSSRAFPKWQAAR